MCVKPAQQPSVEGAMYLPRKDFRSQLFKILRGAAWIPTDNRWHQHAFGVRRIKAQRTDVRSPQGRCCVQAADPTVACDAHDRAGGHSEFARGVWEDDFQRSILTPGSNELVRRNPP